jgi:hypothetical protein
MPRIAAALAVLGTVAFCIGFNTVRYPAVWEMLRRPGAPAVVASPADAIGKRPALTFQPTEPPEEAEFCTADGICHIAGSRQTVEKPEASIASSRVGVSPAPPRGGQTDATPRKAETPASSRAGQTAAASRAGETPAPQPDAQPIALPIAMPSATPTTMPNTMPSLAVGMSEGPKSDANVVPASTTTKRPLVPVADNPSKDKQGNAPAVASSVAATDHRPQPSPGDLPSSQQLALASQPAIAATERGVAFPVTEKSVAPLGSDRNAYSPVTDRNARPPAATGVRPLPAVDQADNAIGGGIPPLPANGSRPFYPTTGYTDVDLSRFGKS